MLNNDYVTLNATFGKEKENERQHVDDLKKQIKGLQVVLSNSQSQAQENFGKFDKFQSDLLGMTAKLNNIKENMEGPLNRKFDQIEQKNKGFNDELIALQAQYSDYQDRTNKILQGAKENQVKMYNNFQGRYKELSEDLEQQKSSNVAMRL